IDTEPLPRTLSRALPEGLDVTGAAALTPRAPALQESVSLVEYLVTVVDSDDRVLAHDVLRPLVRAALDRPELPVTRTRKGRQSTDDIRPAIRGIELGHHHDGAPALQLCVSTYNRGARPP